MYKYLVDYLKEKNIRLDNHLFRAVLKSLNYRLDGSSAREANGWAYTFELIGRVGDGTGTDSEMVKAKKDLAKYAREVWKYYENKNR